MQFLEEKKENTFDYTVEDVFGKIILTSKKKLNSEILDAVFLAVFKTGDTTSSKESVGYIEDLELHYRYIKRSAWEDIETVETKEKALNIKTRIKHFIIKLIKRI